MAKIINCPRCGLKVATWDEKSTSNIVANCKKCRKRIVYYIDRDCIEIKNIPQRNTSSGMTFY